MHFISGKSTTLSLKYISLLFLVYNKGLNINMSLKCKLNHVRIARAQGEQDFGS